MKILLKIFFTILMVVISSCFVVVIMPLVLIGGFFITLLRPAKMKIMTGGECTRTTSETDYDDVPVPPDEDIIDVKAMELGSQELSSGKEKERHHH